MTHPSADNTNPTPDGNLRPKPRRSLLRRLLIIAGCTILAVILIVTATITVAVSYLKPERLTPLVENYANEYLDETPQRRPDRDQLLEHISPL